MIALRIASLCLAFLAVPCAARADDWQPAGISATQTPIADVIAAARRNEPAPAQRRERWTYLNGTHRTAVDVAVRDDDFHTALDLDGLTYTAGRIDGVRWRGDGNGIVHSVLGDVQSDAADIAPQSLFRIDWNHCTLAGETRLPERAWVLETHREAEKPAFLYVDAATGSIVREVFRDGRRVQTTTFDRFETSEGRPRARHWHIDDGVPAYAVDATLDAIEPGPVTADAIALPRRPIIPGNLPDTTIALPAHFKKNNVTVDVAINGGRTKPYYLDTGTASITVDPPLVGNDAITLEHTKLARLDVGPLHFEQVSALTIPFWSDGILGYDFFFGHVVEIGYIHHRVRVLSAIDANAVFTDPKTIVIPINVMWGLPLAHASLGPAESDAFALDTGSQSLYVMRAFATRYAAEITQHWSAMGSRFVTRYLEGGIELKPYRVSRFTFAGISARDLIVGAQIPTMQTDDLLISFDGIIGTDVLANFDLYFDYDNGRLGLRR